MYSSVIGYDIGTHCPCVSKRAKVVEFHFPTVVYIYSGILISRTSRYFEPNLVSLGFASLKLYNFTPDFSNPRFLETPATSNQFWLPWDKLTLDNSNLRKFPNHLVRMSITFTHLNKLSTSIICANVPGTSVLKS